MAQYNKLFDKSEVEFITPFLKLWMSFNNWYKQDLPNVRTDKEAINEYKNQGHIKTEFLRLLNVRSIEGEKFQDTLSSFVKNINDCDFDNFEYPTDLFTRNPTNTVVQSKSLVFISPHNKEFFFTSGDEDRLFEKTLEIIYFIRCKLVHGDFDIDDPLFIDLVEKSYGILYPIMERILQNQADGEFICASISKNVDTKAIFDGGKMTILVGSKVTKNVANSYDKTEEREQILSEKAHEENNYFEITQNIEFNSPSAASSFCLGNSSNGWENWKNKAGKTMNDILRNNLN